MKTILFSFICCLITVYLNAQPGTLDSSFGQEGQVVTDFDSGTSVTVYKGLVQSDNKIIAVGDLESVFPPYNGFFVMRYMSGGSIDSTFADSGKTIITVPFENNLTPSSACLQKDGKILIAGYGYTGWPDIVYSGVIVRLNTDGSIDSSFGTDGAIQTTIGNHGTTYNAITIQPDGKIIGVGTADTRFVNRLLENGSPDISFGTNGYVFYSSYYIFCACVIQPDGKIVIGGGYSSALPEQFLLKRFQSSGEPDLSFGSAGTTVTQVGSYDSYITNLAFQSDGKIVALGSTDNYTASANTRYNADGSPDSTFANDGIAHNFFPGIYGSAVSLLVQDDNKILLGGGVYIEKSLYALERLTMNGLIDSSFGVNGEVTTDFANYSGSGIASIDYKHQQKIVAIGGSSNVNFYNSVSLARYYDHPSQKQIIITKIRHWLQHHNGIEWDNISGVENYVVQRSGDEVNWSNIHSQPSTVNFYNDVSPLNGSNYYRLQTTTANGVINYSNVIAVTSDVNTIKISPNPAINSLHVEGLSSSNKTKLTVVDFAGNIKLQAVVNNDSYNLNITSLTTGNYLLKIEMNGDVGTKKFVKE